MRRKSAMAAAILTVILLCWVPATRADTLELVDGTVIKNCYVRDEGVRLTVWKSLADVVGRPHVYPRSQVKGWKIERHEDWDRHPDKPDLTVTYIEFAPKLAGLHGRVQYDKWGRPWIAGPSELLIDVGERKFIDPQGAVKNLKLKYEPGEELTLTAHIKNIGFREAQPFKIEWLIDELVVERASRDQPLAEMEEATFAIKWKWQEGFHQVTVRILTDQPEIAVINNQATDPLWAFPFDYIVAHGRVDAWHQFRSAYGTFSFEDFYRWHLDIMNLLFEHSVYPAAPEGIKARVRLGRIVYADSVKGHNPCYDGKEHTRFEADGIRYDQGAWGWDDRPEEIETGKWSQTDHTWRNQTEWSLPHELGHQLGLVDWYQLDYPGVDHHVWPDNGEKVTHFMRYPVQMMHWHGPQPYGEVDAAYLNMTIDKPRGYYADFYFANPRENFLHIRDINGRGVPNALVEIFQRGVVVDPDAEPGQDHGVKYFPVIEDGDFHTPPMSKRPVIVGHTSEHGVLRLSNRPAEEVRTLNGFHRTNNPFGNMNVVGPRNLMLARVTRSEPEAPARAPGTPRSEKGRVCYYYLEGHDFVAAWFRGHKDRYVIPLNTPFGSVDSPPPPDDVQVAKADEHHVKVTWTPPGSPRERNYIDALIGYRVYRRVSDDGMKDRPWFPVATLGPDQTQFVVDLRHYPKDVYWFKARTGQRTERFGVSSMAASSVESELIEVLLK